MNKTFSVEVKTYDQLQKLAVELRKEKGLSQNDMAEICNVGRSSIVNFEGNVKGENYKLLFEYIYNFGHDISFLLKTSSRSVSTMARNKLAGKGKSANTEKTGRNYKKEYKEYQGTPERKKYRAKLNQANRDAGTYGKMTKMGKDRSHTKDGKLVLEDRSKNRARNGKDKAKSTKK